jgi:RNA polymerase sigma factor (sigma-70 family)
MSPLVVRRYRAERLLRDEFEQLREKVIGGVSRRLRAAGVCLDASDLDACYAQAWQGLYAAVLDGKQIDNPAAWLALVTYRRAIDEHRSRRSIGLQSLDDERELNPASANAGVAARTARRAAERDFAAELDDRARLRQLFEALRARLSEREQQAATLCYLQGLSRADAAARMGVSESRMRKLMEGRGAGSPGVAAKMGELVHTIGAGEWCEQQGSLMRGLAYGILDPQGERYRLAQLHRDACPACRAYVLSLRGLAAVLPPVPALLPWALGAGAAGGTVAGAGAGTGAGGLGTGVGGGAISASGAAGVGAAGGGWWLAGGPLGAKLAVGCLLALGVGAGCVALDGQSARRPGPEHRHRASRGSLARTSRVGDRALAGGPVSSVGTASEDTAVKAGAGTRGSQVAASSQASREFGPEQAAGTSAPAAGASSHAVARASSVARSPATESAAGGAASSGSAPAAGESSSRSVPAAQREFAPG